MNPWCSFFLALFSGSLVEWLAHRACHSWLFYFRHLRHHAHDAGWHWLVDFLIFYLPMSLPFTIFAYWLGPGWIAGMVVYAALFSWCHARQHAGLSVPWMPAPVHALHHKLRGFRGNYGVVTDFWDRVFRTYHRV